MDTNNAIDIFAALAQATRQEAFRLLVANEPEGLPAGEVARLLEVPHNTMSSHLAVLARAGLVRSQRQSRSVIYRANLDAIRDTVQFLVQDCCGGRPDVCQPLLDSLQPCCPPPANGASS
jgi:DNA-binding transcriptional ArsR family regulator